MIRWCSLTVRGTFLSTAVAFALYWSLAAFGVPSAPMNDLLDGSLVAIAALVAFKYSSWTLLNFRRAADQRFLIRYGIVLVWFGTVLWRVERFAYQEQLWGAAPVGAHDYSRGFFILIQVVGAAAHVIGIETENGRPPWVNVLSVAGAILFGAFAILVLQLYLGSFAAPH